MCPQPEHPKFMVLLKNLDMTHPCSSGEALGHGGAVGRTRRSHGCAKLHQKVPHQNTGSCKWVKWQEKLIPGGIKPAEFLPVAFGHALTSVLMSGAAHRAPEIQLGEEPGQKKKRNKPRKVSKIHLLLPEHPPCSSRACKEAADALFPQLFQQKPRLRLSGKVCFPSLWCCREIPKTRRICKCFFTRNTGVLQGGNFATAAGDVTALNWDKTKSLDGHGLLEELCWAMLVSCAS